MRFLRFSFVTLPLILLLGIVWPVVSLLFCIFGASPDSQLELGRMWARIFLKLSFIRVRYTGLDRFKALNSCVVIANHASLLDIPVLYDLPVKGSIFAQKKLFSNPLLFIQLRAGHHLPVGGVEGRDTIKSIRIALRSIMQGRRSLLIFPEEGHVDAALHQFHEGAAFIAIMAKVPIVPIGLSKTREFMGGTMYVRIGEPIETTGLTVADRGWLTKRLHERVSELLV
jgi:1-acyl-sn-glycerol-3-phosphate acyltransferase